MTVTDWILGGILLLVIGSAVAYIVRAKKSGVQCIGCPACGKCAGHCPSHEPESADKLPDIDDQTIAVPKVKTDEYFS